MDTVVWFGGSFCFFYLENGGSCILRNIGVCTKVYDSISRKTAICGILSFYMLQVFQAPECLQMVSALTVYTFQSAIYWIPLMSLCVVLFCCLWRWSGRVTDPLTSDHRYSALTAVTKLEWDFRFAKQKTGKLVSHSTVSVRLKSDMIVVCVFREALKNVSVPNRTQFFCFCFVV